MPSRTFTLPDLGEGLEDAEVVQWLVAVGEEVTVDQPLLEVETAKANVEIPSPFAGTVATLHAQPGETVAVGGALVTIALPDDHAADAPGVAPARPLVGFGAADEPRPRRPTERATGTPHQAASTRPGPVLATPPVRKRARELGIDLAAIPGTGPQEAVTVSDLDAFVARVETSSTPALVPEPGAESRRVPVRGVRRLVAEEMATSRREIPDASTWVDCDATELLALCAAIDARHSDVKVTPLALVLRACVAGLRRYPALNSRFDAAAGEIELLVPVHLGFAAQTERGLVVPVIKDAHDRSTLEIAAELRRLAGDARDGTLAPSELVGSTFTVSNYGAFGVDGGVAIINHPEVAILGVGRITEKPWVVDGTVEARAVVQLSLSFDHRVMDGGDAGGFLRFVADCVEQPAALVAVV
jgi:2-oxoisovalerate dehydrogenase E2 component (dihydrolipoyl transacylase)